VPAWGELKPSSPTTEAMFNLKLNLPDWWTLNHRTNAIASERLGTIKSSTPVHTEMCAIDLGDGYWRIYIHFSED